MTSFGSLTDHNLPSRITPTLYIGSLAQASCNADRLAACRITHIVNATAEHANVHADDARFTHHRIGVKDASSARLDVHFERVAALQKEAAARDGSATLIHCFEGVSRSATLGLACMLINGDAASLTEAIKAMRAQRPVVGPNPGFWTQLQRLEKRLAGGDEQKDTPLDTFDKLVGLVSSLDTSDDVEQHVPPQLLDDTVKALSDTLDDGTTLEACLTSNLERYASTASKHDAQAQQGMALVLRRLPRAVVVARMEAMRKGAVWKDIALDAPLADKHAQELLAVLKQSSP